MTTVHVSVKQRKTSLCPEAYLAAEHRLTAAPDASIIPRKTLDASWRVRWTWPRCRSAECDPGCSAKCPQGYEAAAEAELCLQRCSGSSHFGVFILGPGLFDMQIFFTYFPKVTAVAKQELETVADFFLPFWKTLTQS